MHDSVRDGAKSLGLACLAHQLMSHVAELLQRGPSESPSGFCALLVNHSSWPTRANQPPRLFWGWTRPCPPKASGVPPEAALGVMEGGCGPRAAAEAG